MLCLLIQRQRQRTNDMQVRKERKTFPTAPHFRLWHPQLTPTTSKLYRFQFGTNNKNAECKFDSYGFTSFLKIWLYIRLCFCFLLYYYCCCSCCNCCCFHSEIASIDLLNINYHYPQFNDSILLSHNWYNVYCVGNITNTISVLNIHFIITFIILPSTIICTLYLVLCSHW